MKLEEAEKIIDKFHNSIEDLRPDSIVQSHNELPYTYGKIKQAHFVYIEEHLLENRGAWKVSRAENKEQIEHTLQLVKESYGIIESFFPENPEPINKKYRKYLEGLKNGVITDFLIPNPFGECTAVLEVHNFIDEWWFSKYREYMWDKEVPLATFIYDIVRKKLTEEKDIKALIKLANTAKTRTVIFPGRKSNEESIFIRV